MSKNSLTLNVDDLPGIRATYAAWVGSPNLGACWPAWTRWEESGRDILPLEEPMACDLAVRWALSKKYNIGSERDNPAYLYWACPRIAKGLPVHHAAGKWTAWDPSKWTGAGKWTDPRVVGRNATQWVMKRDDGRYTWIADGIDGVEDTLQEAMDAADAQAASQGWYLP